MSLYSGSTLMKSRLGSNAYKINFYKPDPPAYLTFSSPSTFSISVSSPSWDGTIEYSIDTKTWSTWDGSEISGTEIYLRGSNNTIITGEIDIDYRWSLSGSNISCSGNIETLLDYATVTANEHPDMGDICYGGMFSGCTSLIQAPELPATTLASDCYSCMFENCTGLLQAPELPATTLASDCYQGMFYGCTSLIQAPKLPATTLAEFCYGSMFQDCTNLIQAPELPATTLAGYCYDHMFSGCTSLIQAPKLPATTLAEFCYDCMFSGCTSLTQAPELPATTLASYCYDYMFSGCTSLTQAPKLPATILAKGCYCRMFSGCTKIKLSSTQTGNYSQVYRIPTSGTGTTASYALLYMFISTGGTFTGTPTINTTYYLHSSNTIV